MISIFDKGDRVFHKSRSGGLEYIVSTVSGAELLIQQNETCYGAVLSGMLSVSVGNDSNIFNLKPGMFFSVSNARLRADSFSASLAIVCKDVRSLTLFGGPTEAVGRLKYIDGCSDSVLIAPQRRGDPCVNHIHIPAHTNQRMHFHPSDRVGTILAGSGSCVTRGGVRQLSAGQAWIIPENTHHHFRTEEDTMDVLTWHPDSDFGPTDEDHPMINRTWTNA